MIIETMVVKPEVAVMVVVAVVVIAVVVVALMDVVLFDEGQHSRLLRDGSGLSHVENTLISGIFETCVTDQRTDGRTHGHTDIRTDPLIEMRGRI